jgi:flagellar basal-body rod protein FlgB
MFGAGDIPLAAAGELDAAARGAPAAPVTAAQGAGAGLDGNAVDVDRALAAVAENAIQYNAAARAAQKKLAILRYVASDGAA